MKTYYTSYDLFVHVNYILLMELMQAHFIFCLDKWYDLIY